MTSDAGHAAELPISIKGVLIHDGRVLLLLNARDEWDLPGGRPDAGEDMRAALRREILEETGLAVEVGAALGEHMFEVLPGRFVRILAFACRLLADAPLVLSAEHFEARWYPVEQLDDGMIDGHRLPAGYLAAVRRALDGSRSTRQRALPPGDPPGDVPTRVVEPALGANREEAIVCRCGAEP